jgi:hypothetical protein
MEAEPPDMSYQALPGNEYNNWLPGRAWEPISRGSASAQTMEAEPPDMSYQALPGNEYNHLGLLYLRNHPLNQP